MSIDVYVVMRNDSTLGDLILRNFWLAASKIFKEYGIEVYVIPLITPTKGKGVSVIINGFEIPLRTVVTVNEAIDIILKYLTIRNESEEVYAIGVYVDRDDSLDNVVEV